MVYYTENTNDIAYKYQKICESDEILSITVPAIFEMFVLRVVAMTTRDTCIGYM